MTKQCYILTDKELEKLLYNSICYDILVNDNTDANYIADSNYIDRIMYNHFLSINMKDLDIEDVMGYLIHKELLQYKQDGNYVLPQVTRCDVIINGERVRHRDIELTLSIQDDGRTLKVFIDTPIPDEAFDHVIQKDNIIRELLDMTKDYRK